MDLATYKKFKGDRLMPWGKATVVKDAKGYVFLEADGRSRDEVLGPPLCRIYERSAVRPPPPNAPAPPSLRIFALRASRILSWWLRGLGRPTPFFHDHTNAPLSVPRVLTASERAAFLNSA